MPQAESGLRRCLSGVRDLFFPPKCAACGDLLPPFDGTAVFCPSCREAWDEARLLAAEAAAVSAVAGHAYLVGYRAGKADGVPERLIYHLKHKGTPRAFAFAASSLAMGVRVALTAAGEACSQEGSTTDASPAKPPLVTYPPRRRAGIREDGFDQAERLARALSQAVEGDFCSLLRRVHAPETEQKTLDSEERAQNAARSYALRKNAADRVRGRVVVLCDDLSTSGATLDACAALLSEAGAVVVVKATVAQTDKE